MSPENHERWRGSIETRLRVVEKYCEDHEGWARQTHQDILKEIERNRALARDHTDRLREDFNVSMRQLTWTLGKMIGILVAAGAIAQSVISWLISK